MTYNGFEWHLIDYTNGGSLDNPFRYAIGGAFATAPSNRLWLVGAGIDHDETYIGSGNVGSWYGIDGNFPTANGITGGRACFFNGEVYVAGGQDPNTNAMYNKVWKWSD